MMPSLAPLVVALTVGSLSLQSALEETVERQPLLRAASARRSATAAQVASSRGELLPQVNLSVQGFMNTANNPPTAWVAPTDIIRSGTRPAAYADLSQWHPFGSTIAGVGVRQPIVDAGAWGRLEAARANDSAAEAGYELSVQDALLRTAEGFYRAIAAEEDHTVARAAMQRARTQREAAEAGVKAGFKPALDGVRALANEAAAEVRVHETQGLVDISRAALAIAMGRSDARLEEELVRSPTLALTATHTPEDVKPSGASQTASASVRPDLIVLQREADAAEANARAARGVGLPQLSLVGSASYRGFDEFVPDTPNWGVGLVASVPLFLGGSPTADAERERSRSRELLARKQSLQDRVTYEILESERLVAANTRALAAAERQVEAARAGVEQADGRYRQGLGNIVEVVDAQTLLASAEQSLVRTRLTVGLAQVRLLYNRGALHASTR